MVEDQSLPRPALAAEPQDQIEHKRRVRRRRLIKAVAATGAGVVAVSGVYIKPSIRPLDIPTAHAFSF